MIELIKKYLKVKYPDQYELASTYIEKMEKNLVKSAGSIELKVSDQEKKAFEFIEERKNGILRKYGITTGINSTINNNKTDRLDKVVSDPDEHDFFHFLENGNTHEQQQEYLRNNKSTQFWWSRDMGELPKITFYNKQYESAYISDLKEKSSKDLISLQRQRKKLRESLDKKRDQMVSEILETIPDPRLKERLNNIKKCEELPLSGG